MSDEFAEQVAGVAALAEPVRLDLYRYVVGQAEPVSRDQASAGCGIARHTAKFHLDKLVDEGWLDIEFRRLTGREGPGAGRPAKLYRRSDREVSVSVPQRAYQLAGELMASAIDDIADRPEVTRALHRAAAARGRSLGAAVKEALGRHSGRSALVEATCSALAGCGYEPRTADGEITLHNCPFYALAQDHTELVCGMNLALLQEMVRTSADGRLGAQLDPAEGRCCVTVTDR